jgi:hypothetical protein
MLGKVIGLHIANNLIAMQLIARRAEEYDCWWAKYTESL